MHELSLAMALTEQVRVHVPDGVRVRRVHLRVGPLQGIVPEALEFGWTAATTGGSMEGSKLVLNRIPWHLSCPECGRDWTSHEPYDVCTCGCVGALPRGDDELTLVSIEVDEAPVPS